VNLLCLVSSSGLASADSPNGLISDNELCELLLCEVEYYLLELLLAYLEVATSLALLEILTPRSR
jgi:hypothetical protein